ncbi:MAG: twin-arginine translocase subunit TatB [Pseudomonadales bacterium]|nr:twin-arginine translocase subunit TatB [Halioglobus sp.]MCP5128504.1 twin-arginine translocase subunit TatB [Pseudomonadales bacterium]
MFDIGFAELILVGVVGLLVIGPERLPGAIRTVSVSLNRLKRGFNDIKREVQLELHNDEVMQELRKTGQQIKAEADSLGQDIDLSSAGLERPAAEVNPPAEPEAQAAQPAQTPDKNAE